MSFFMILRWEFFLIVLLLKVFEKRLIENNNNINLLKEFN